MPYYPDKLTDEQLEALERRIAEVYRQAEKDLQQEVNAYFAKFKLRDKEMQDLVAAGEMSKAEYQQWRLTQMGRGKRFEALRDKVAERYTKANEVANAYVNDATPSIYSLNRNYEAYTIEKTVGSCDFTMWDESTVRRLLVEEPDIMPYYPKSRALQRGFDLAYGKEQITKHVTSGIIRGLPPGKIAAELMSSITTMNRVSAVRAARTGITTAQNAGRMDSYVAAEKMGIQIKRRWICTKDSRTRLDHGLADGQIVVGTSKPFKVGPDLMMFPGDQSMGAHGYNLYNCRCTTRTVEKDGIEAEPRQMRVTNPKWEEAKAEENKLSAKVERLKEREQAETDPAKRKQLRAERIKAQKDLEAAAQKRRGIDKDLVVNEMSYSDWLKWKKTGVKPEPPKKETPRKTRMRRDPSKFRNAQAERTKPNFDAMDKKDLERYVSEHIRTHIESTKGVDTEFLREATKVLYEFENKMGGNTIEGLTVKFGGVGAGRYAAYDYKTKTLLLKKTGNIEQFNESQRKVNELSLYKRKKVWYATEDYSGTVWHELGHAVDHDTDQQLSRLLSATKELDTKSVRVSGYAGSSPAVGAPKRSEAWAENFAAYMNGGETASDVPHEISTMIEDYFAKKRE